MTINTFSSHNIDAKQHGPILVLSQLFHFKKEIKMFFMLQYCSIRKVFLIPVLITILKTMSETLLVLMVTIKL